MCGIAGIIDYKGNVQLDKLKSMTDSIVHRGPDGEGHWISDSKKVGFGHRRLSIIDLSEGGHQPMHFLGRYTITYNGEIYNYLELRTQLESEGVKFKTKCDTEVLLAMYAKKGVDCLQELDGMFAFAIWDEEKQELFCARDRFGEKPFHYFFDDEQFIFGSEMKEIWAAGVKRTIRQDKLQNFVTPIKANSQFELTDTYFEGINRLNAAHWLKIDRTNKVTIGKYWSLDNIEIDHNISLEEATNKYYELFEDSVQLRLRSDVPVGSSLSGGLDSSSIVCLIDKIKSNSQTQKVFSARFRNFEKDEGVFIDKVVESCSNVEPFTTYPAEEDMLSFMEKALHHQEEPFGSSSILAQWKVMELAKNNNVTVLMDGQGADEYLAGYTPDSRVYINQLFFENRKKYQLEYDSYIKQYGHLHSFPKYEDSETTRMKLGRFKKQLLGQSINYLTLKQRLNTMLTGGSLQNLLRFADRNAMAHSLEVRLPFLSHKLVEFAYSLPDHFLLFEGWTKYIHRKALEPVLPNDICWRKDKIGYEPPQQRWLEDKNIKEIIRAQQLKYDIPDRSMKSGKYTNSMDWKLLMTFYFTT
jgi:asparagine synthase (glutamine-hydrolysing)